MRFQKGNPGKRPKYNWYEIERLAKLGIPLSQLAVQFGVPYGRLRVVSCRQKWGIARIYGYKHRFRKGEALLPIAQKPANPTPEPSPPAQAIPLPAGPSWHREFDHKWLAELCANEHP
jgi:hypothetical protein